MLAQLLGHILSDDVLSPFLDYLVRKRVLEEHLYAFALPKGKGDLATYPDDARAYLERAIVEHAKSSSCPQILRDVLLDTAAVGIRSQCSASVVPNIASVERLLWDRSIHVAALSDFGWTPEAAAEEVGPDRGLARPKADDVLPAAHNLALAHRLAQMIESGLIADYTAAAKLIGVSQPRLTHLMALTLLAPQIQEAILFGTVKLGDKQLRRLASIAEWPEQLAVLLRL